MTMNVREMDNALKVEYLEQVRAMFTEAGEDVQRVGNNEIAFPIVDAAGNEKWMVVKFTIPTGSRDGDAYDGYAMAEDYQMKLRAKEDKKKEQARKSAERKAKKESEKA